MKQELRLSGTGGQGLILAGIILAEAALLDGKLAIQSQSYGPEARGGSSKSEVMISDQTIHFPKVTEPDLLLAMSQEAANKYSYDSTAKTILVTDSLFVKNLPKFDGKIYELPITVSAKQTLGKVLFSNIIALGALVKITGVVSEESLIKAVLSRVPKGTEDKNKQALQLGIDLAAAALT
jgi:2-oxoglutarate ferredoxin oxidoreductase subunit gamma